MPSLQFLYDHQSVTAQKRFSSIRNWFEKCTAIPTSQDKVSFKGLCPFSFSATSLSSVYINLTASFIRFRDQVEKLGDFRKSGLFALKKNA